MTRKLVFTALLLVAIVLMGTTVAVAQDGSILQRIIDRGELICGVNDQLPGFGTVNDAGEFEGFDTDICRAVAAAVLGDANAVSFRALAAADRPTALASGEIDMLSRNTTWTLSRDTEWGATFGPTTFYDGQGVMVKVEFGVSNMDELAEETITICTNAGTTTELNITDQIEARGADWTLNTFQDFDAVMDAYNADACDAVTTDTSGLVSRKAVAADPGAHLILPEVISKEPLGPLSPQTDPAFADVIRWTVYGLIQAEEFGITSDNVMDFVGSDNANIQRFLGSGENSAGDYLGIPNDFMVNVISQVGNYSEIFERNLGVDTVFGLSRGVNGLWTDGGLLYSPPFR